VSHCMGKAFNYLFAQFYSIFVFLTMLGMVFLAPGIGAAAAIGTVIMRGAGKPPAYACHVDDLRLFHLLCSESCG
jgi:hypothetical protein